MPLPLNSSIELRIEPRGSSATLVRGWPRAAALARAECAADADAPGAAEGVLGPLLKELASKARLNGAPLRAALSSTLIQFDVVAGEFADSSERQLKGIAAACMAELLGDQADDHELRWHLQSDERHLLICAIERSQLAQLRQAAAAQGLRLSSVTPAFVLAWNAFAASLPEGESVFAVSGVGDLTIAAVIDGAIAAISVEQPVDDRSRPRAAPRAAAREPARLTDFVPSVPAQAAAAQFTFSADVAERGDARALDTVVDRFVARLGRDPASQSAHVLVCDDGAMPFLSGRWKRVGTTRVSP